jgi:hypothetical protein
MELTQEQRAKIKKVAKLVDFESKGAISLLEYLYELEDKYEKEIPELSELIEELKKERPDRQEIKEMVDEILSSFEMRIPKDGEDGKDYILTEDDKKEIASKITVPKPQPDKIIEKHTETVKIEQPIEIIKEVAVITDEEITSRGEAIRDGLELLQDDDRLDKKAIKGLDDYDEVARLAREPRRSGMVGKGLLSQMNDVNIQSPTNGQGLVYNSTTGLWENGAGGGGTTPNLQQVTDLGSTTTNTIELPAIQALTSAGGTIKSHSGANVAEFGAGGGQNWTFEDGVKLNGGTASRVLLTDANKNIAYSTLTSDELEESILSFENYSKNLKSYPYTITETSPTITTIAYTTPSGIINKTITEVSPTVTTIVFSGDYPAGLPTTKTITETSPTLITIIYS